MTSINSINHFFQQFEHTAPDHYDYLPKLFSGQFPRFTLVDLEHCDHLQTHFELTSHGWRIFYSSEDRYYCPLCGNQQGLACTYFACQAPQILSVEQLHQALEVLGRTRGVGAGKIQIRFHKTSEFHVSTLEHLPPYFPFSVIEDILACTYTPST